MAIAHAGYNPRGTPRLRILITLCELTESGAACSYRDLQRRLDMSAGAVSHHISQLEADGFVARSGRARALKLTAKAHAELIAGAWLVPTEKVISFALSAAAVELLETARD